MSAPELDRQCSYATHSAEYCHAHSGYLIDYDTGICDKYALDKAARWDARDEALRALIEQWRAYGHARIQHAADELERAIGGGR